MDLLYVAAIIVFLMLARAMAKGCSRLGERR